MTPRFDPGRRPGTLSPNPLYLGAPTAPKERLRQRKS